MQLRQSEPFGVLDDHDRRLGHVDADLDDRGRDQDLRLPALEPLHRRVPLGTGHLAVHQPDRAAEDGAKRFRALLGRRHVEGLALVDQRANPIGARPRGGRLPEARDHFAEPFDRQDAGVDRLAPGRLLAQRGDIHVAEIGQHQRARDRSRGHHQQVDGRALGGEREPLADAEAMLLVDHRKPEIGERDALLDQRMGADGDVDFALRQFGERGAARRQPGRGR